MVKGEADPGVVRLSNGIIEAKESNDKDRQQQIDQSQPGVAPTSSGMKKGGKVSSASARADGCCVRGKTRGRFV